MPLLLGVLPLLVSLDQQSLAMWPNTGRTRSNSPFVHQFGSFLCPCGSCLSSSRHRSPCHLALSCCWALLSHLLDTVRCVAGTGESLLSSLRRCPDSASGVGPALMMVFCQKKIAFFIDELKRSPDIDSHLRMFSCHTSRAFSWAVSSEGKVFTLRIALMRLCTLGAVFGAYFVINARHARAPFISVIPLITLPTLALSRSSPRRGRVSWLL